VANWEDLLVRTVRITDGKAHATNTWRHFAVGAASGGKGWWWWGCNWRMGGGGEQRCGAGGERELRGAELERTGDRKERRRRTRRSRGGSRRRRGRRGGGPNEKDRSWILRQRNQRKTALRHSFADSDRWPEGRRTLSIVMPALIAVEIQEL
jgi:hypothetical protein